MPLDYGITTEPFPLQASPEEGTAKPSNLTITASNRTPKEPITIDRITITLPVGPDASDLTIAAPEIGEVLAPKNWKCTKRTKAAGVVIYTFVPDAGHKIITDQGLPFFFNNIVVNLRPGIFHVEVEENEVDLTILKVTKFPYGWGNVAFGVDPAVINAGEETKLDWHGPAGAEYKIEYLDPVTRTRTWISDLSNDGTVTLKLAATTAFNLHVYKTISGRHYHAHDQKTVTVIPPPPSIEYFRPRGCTGSDCVIYSDEFEIEWSVLNAEPGQCQMTQEWTNSQGRKVTEVVPLIWKDKFVHLTPTERKVTYTLMVKKDNFEVTATVTATLLPPVPVGTIVPYGSRFANNLPPGWLYCNGSEYSTKQYPELNAVIDTLYGTAKVAGNGKLPDLRGYFVRGYDDKRGIDSGRQMGSFQEDAFKSHTHGQKVTANAGYGSGIRADYNHDASKLGEYDQGVQTHAAGDPAETRPKNMACYFVIYAGVPKPVLVKEPTKKTSKKTARKRRG